MVVAPRKIPSLVKREEELQASELIAVDKTSGVIATSNFSPLACGLPRILLSHGEMFSIGLIDYLAPYELKKKTANFFKTFLFTPPTLSTIPAPDYAKRMVNYVPFVIQVPDSLVGRHRCPFFNLMRWTLFFLQVLLPFLQF
jgi:hypothetical protein